MPARRRRPAGRPRTSAEAWKDIQAKIPALHARILRSVTAAGGLTDDEIEKATGLSHQNVSARTSEMRTAGILRDSGVRRFTRNGRKAAVWINTEAPAAVGAQLTMIDDQAERERPRTWHD